MEFTALCLHYTCLPFKVSSLGDFCLKRKKMLVGLLVSTGKLNSVLTEDETMTEARMMMRSSFSTADGETTLTTVALCGVFIKV